MTTTLKSTFRAIQKLQESMVKHKTSHECCKQIWKAIHPKARAIQITSKAIYQKTKAIHNDEGNS